MHERFRENYCINDKRHIRDARKANVIDLNHGAIQEIQDGHQHVSRFY